MTVTDIKQTKAGRWSVFIDGEFVFSTDDMTLYEYGIVKGTQIDAQTLSQLAGDTLTAKLTGRAIDLLSYRDHSKRELVDKLARSSDRGVAEEAVAHLEESGLVDDRRFAAAYAQEVCRTKSWGPRRIRFELQSRGISPEIAVQTVEELEIDEEAAIREIVLRKYSLPFDQKTKKRAFDYLYRLGYGSGEIAAVLRELGCLQENEEEYVD